MPSAPSPTHWSSRAEPPGAPRNRRLRETDRSGEYQNCDMCAESYRVAHTEAQADQAAGYG